MSLRVTKWIFLVLAKPGLSSFVSLHPPSIFDNPLFPMRELLHLQSFEKDPGEENLDKWFNESPVQKGEGFLQGAETQQQHEGMGEEDNWTLSVPQLHVASTLGTHGPTSIPVPSLSTILLTGALC